jgi:16S rRNA (adenine1518-N6/adenine1519-N6)-dimethyltransferase
MLQKEFAERLLEDKRKKEYSSRLSILTRCAFSVKMLRIVNRKEFRPIPQVDSMLIQLIPDNTFHYLKDNENFHYFIQQAFNQRRKILFNSLKLKNNQLSHPLLYKRAEELSIEEFYSLFKALSYLKINYLEKIKN